MSSGLPIGFLADGLPNRGVDDILPFVHQLSLNLQHDWPVHHDPPNDIVSGLDGVVMPDHLCTLEDGHFEKTIEEFEFASYTGVGRDPTPRVGDENDVL